MPRRYLFGPVFPGFAEVYLTGHRRAGRCFAFHPRGAPGDLTVGPDDRWEAVLAQLPADWQPEFIVLRLPAAHVPAAVSNAPLPMIALAGDCKLNWSAYRSILPACDLVLSDAAGARALAREGLTNVRAADLIGLGSDWLGLPRPSAERDLDVAYVGTTNPASDRDHLPFLARLARLADRYRVAIRPDLGDAELKRLYSRTKVVLCPGDNELDSSRQLQAAAAGALPFTPVRGREPNAGADPQTLSVGFHGDELEELLDHYLERDDERIKRASTAQDVARGCLFERRWEAALAGIETEWPDLVERASRRTTERPRFDIKTRLCLHADAPGPATRATLLREVSEASTADPANPVWTLWANLLRRSHQPGDILNGLMQHRTALPTPARQSATAGVALTEELKQLQQVAKATETARQALSVLERAGGLSAADFELPLPSSRKDELRVEWDRAGWAHAGNPTDEAAAKSGLIRWRLHALLADLTSDLTHYHEAVLARPDLAVSRAALGCVLARSGRLTEALPHLRSAVAADPFDRPAARALFQVLGELELSQDQRRLAREQQLLARVAPVLASTESWFAECAPPEGELASILVLCCNEVALTRLCLESVLIHTRQPFELVLVDNGSTDGTADYLRQVVGRPEPDRVYVIHNDLNVGFPAGCNQALAHARGSWLVFLNNDTIVSRGWLEGLTAPALAAWPTVGLVGPVSNYAPPPQHVPPGYSDPAGLDRFAVARQAAHDLQAVPVERLTGFCLLTRRDVLESVGGLDERYGLGFFEDDDLCIRVRRAGLRLLMAPGVYIHHFGSRTFRALGVDCTGQLARNLSRYREKWGDEAAERYRLDGPEYAPGNEPTSPRSIRTYAAAVAYRPRVSLCMIVRNEEANLPDCLASSQGVFDEVVVVDTGSTDATRTVAQRHGAQVFDFPWVDDFAAARNESLRRATGDWAFWLDADDRLDAVNRDRLRAFLARLTDENVAYVLKCVCPPAGPGEAETAVDHVRLFRNRPDVRWQYRVHEQILPGVRCSGGEVRWTDIVVRHVGYQDPALRARKLDRDMRILRLEQAANPSDPFTLFNLGQVLLELGRPADALPLLLESLDRSHPSDSIVRKLYALVATCHRRLGQPVPAAAALVAGLSFYPDDAELLFLDGLVRRDRGDLGGAAVRLEELLASRPGEHFASVDTGLRGFKARHNLALIYAAAGRVSDAEEQWRRVLVERPDFFPAREAYVDLLAGQGRWADLDMVTGKTRGLAADLRCAPGLWARAVAAPVEVVVARNGPGAIVAESPGTVGPSPLVVDTLSKGGYLQADDGIRDVSTLGDPQLESDHEPDLALHGIDPAGRLGEADRQRLFVAACHRDTDLRDLLPSLLDLARAKRRVVALGSRGGEAALALLHAQPESLELIDPVRCPNVDLLEAMAGETRLAFRRAEPISAIPVEADLLFVRGVQTADELTGVLSRHAPQATRLVVHGAVARAGEALSELTRGLRRFLLTNPEWVVSKSWDVGRGMTLLSRDPADHKPLPTRTAIAASFTASVARHAAFGGCRASQQLVRLRMNECAFCESRVIRRCAECGCALKVKASWADSECPLGKWPKEPMAESGDDQLRGWSPSP